MSYTLKYKGYQGFISYCATSSMIVGRIGAIPETVIFEARNLQQLKQEFEIAVDCYLEFCQLENAHLSTKKSYTTSMGYTALLP
jgi:predicted HicB family RNase H-like nuclease